MVAYVTLQIRIVKCAKTSDNLDQFVKFYFL
jgi:hypothetical protein